MKQTSSKPDNWPCGPGLARGWEQGTQRVHDRTGLFARHEMAGTGYDVPCSPCWKECHVTLRTAGRRRCILCPMQHDRRHRDRRSCGEVTLDLVEARVARGIAVAVAVGVDYHRHEIRVVEGWGRAVEGGVVEAPARRPLLP